MYVFVDSRLPDLHSSLFQQWKFQIRPIQWLEQELQNLLNHLQGQLSRIIDILNPVDDDFQKKSQILLRHP